MGVKGIRTCVRSICNTISTAYYQNQADHHVAYMGNSTFLATRLLQVQRWTNVSNSSGIQRLKDFAFVQGGETTLNSKITLVIPAGPYAPYLRYIGTTYYVQYLLTLVTGALPEPATKIPYTTPTLTADKPPQRLPLPYLGPCAVLTWYVQYAGTSMFAPNAGHTILGTKVQLIALHSKWNLREWFSR